MREWTFHLGLLGGGGISATHARAAAEIPGVELVAVCGANAARVSALAAAHGARAYSEMDAFLGHPGMDAVVIGSPSGLHGRQVAAAAERGLHVLVEKPLDISTAAADAAIAACARAGVTLAVVFQDRTAPAARWLKDLIDSGGMGRPFLASAQVRWFRPTEYYAGSRWRGTRALDGGGAVINQGIHTLDLLLWLLGDVTAVTGRTRTALHAIEVEDTAVGTLEFQGGAVATFEATTAAYPGSERRVELTGTEGTVVLEGDRVARAALRAQPTQPPPAQAEGGDNRSSSAALSDAAGHRRVLEDFLQAVRTGRPPLCDGGEGRRSVALVEAFYRSAATGSSVRCGGAI